MKSYPSIYYRFGRVGSQHEYNWMEDSTNYIDKLKIDILKFRNKGALIAFLIDILKVDTLSILFLNSLGTFAKLNSDKFESTKILSDLIKKVEISFFKGIEQIQKMDFSFKEAMDEEDLSKVLELAVSKDDYQIIHKIDDEVTLIINFSRNWSGKIDRMHVEYVSDILES